LRGGRTQTSVRVHEVQSDSETGQPTAPTPSPPRVIEFFRTGEGAFVTGNRGALERPVSATASIHSVEEVLKRHRVEMSKSDTANISVKEAFRTRGDDAKKVITAELKQMLDKRVWVPVMGGKLTAMQRATTIRSSMFLKRKNNPDGSFLKLKARLVAGGDQQDKGLYEDLSSPTVSTSAVFTLLAVAAHEQRDVAVVDISGAYLNADMTLGVPVHMRLDHTMTEMITDMDTSRRPYTGVWRVRACGMRTCEQPCSRLGMRSTVVTSACSTGSDRTDTSVQ
jgi:Reverse transcriptase (RNA-dependent DNA polymerase)